MEQASVGAAAGLSATAGELAVLLRGELEGPAGLRVSGFAGIESAGPGDLTFIRDARYAGQWASSRASVAIATAGLRVEGHDPAARALIRVVDADMAMVALLEAVEARRRAVMRAAVGVHATAVVGAGAKIGPGASVGPLCVVGEGAWIGDGAVLHPRVTVGPGVRVGGGSELHPGVVLQPGTVVGEGCVLHPGVVIGGDGFGYRPSGDGVGLVKIPHVGGVRIGDGVEIGSLSAVDRGKFGDTVIGAGTKIDNLVQIGHNAQIGQSVVICGACAIGGSTRIGDGAMLGGACAVADNVLIEAGARLAGGAFVAGNIPAGEPYAGMPARPARQVIRERVNAASVDKLKVTIREMGKRLDKLEGRG